MDTVSASWSIGYLVGWPVWVILLVAIAIVAWAFFSDDEPAAGLGWTAAFIGTLIFMLSPWGLYPTGGADYHKWSPKSGEVESVNKRLVSKDKSMEEKYVIVFKGSPQEYGVEDTRAALIQSGDKVVVKCKRHYQWGSTPGYNCRWVSRTAKVANG